MPTLSPPPAEAADAESPNIRETLASHGAVDPARRRQRVTAGVAVGIGSAAIVAALLYASRWRRGK